MPFCLTFYFGGIMYERSCIVIDNLESIRNEELLSYNQAFILYTVEYNKNTSIIN